MGKSLADVNREVVKLYNTDENTYEDFPEGTPVKIITKCQDFHFFYGETGVVIRNKGTYLSIKSDKKKKIIDKETDRFDIMDL